MGKASVTVKDNSKSILSGIEQARERSLEKIGLVAEGYAKQLAPVDTGRLRNSITHEVDGKDVFIGSNAEYAAPVEYGTIKMAAQPFLRPAATDHANDYNAIIQDEYSKIKT